MADRTQAIAGQTNLSPRERALFSEEHLRKRMRRMFWFTIALVLAVSFFFPLYVMVRDWFNPPAPVTAAEPPCGLPSKVASAMVMVVVEAALLMVYVFESELLRWLASPG